MAQTKLRTFIKGQPILVKLFRLWQRRNFFNVNDRTGVSGVGNNFHIEKNTKLNGCKFEIVGNHNVIVVGESSLLKDVIFYIRGSNNKILIGNQVSFNHGSSLWIEDNNCAIRIGNRTTFENVHIAVTESGSSITIGSDCMFASDIDIRTGDSHSIIDAVTMKRINHAKNVEIEDHVWVASHVTILKGVKIEKNSVVSTRSVVTKSLGGEGVLIGGAPARIMKENITWDRSRLV